MFRKGGSAEGGITSGLQSPRQGYAEPGSVQQNDSSRQRIMNAMGAAPRGKNFNDFLINFGLDIASRPPIGSGIGGAISTAAQAAKGPYEQFAKANQAEQNLLRQVGMEAEIMDINKENAAAAAAAKEAGAMSRLEKQIQADKDLYNMEEGNIVNKQIEAEAAILASPDGGLYNTYQPAVNHATWKYRKSKEKDANGNYIYDQAKIAGVLTQNQVTDAQAQAKFAKSQVKKNGEGIIYYDPFNNRVLETAVVNGEYILRPVSSAGEDQRGLDTASSVVKKLDFGNIGQSDTVDITQVDGESSAFAQDMQKLFANNEFNQLFRRLGERAARGYGDTLAGSPAGRIYGYFTDNPAEAKERSKSIEASKWFRTDEAKNYFLQNPNQLTAAAVDPTGWYNKFKEGEFGTGE